MSNSDVKSMGEEQHSEELSYRLLLNLQLPINLQRE